METNRKDFKIQKNFALSWRIRTATIKTCRASKPPYPECFNWKSGQKVSGQKNKIPFTGPSGWDRCQPHRLKAVTKSGEELLCVNPDKHLAWAKQQNDGESNIRKLSHPPRTAQERHVNPVRIILPAWDKDLSHISSSVVWSPICYTHREWISV